MDFPDAAELIGEFGLRLFSGLGFETAPELRRRVRSDRAEIIRHRHVAAFVAELRISRNSRRPCTSRSCPRNSPSTAPDARDSPYSLA